MVVRDINEIAFSVVRSVTGSGEKPTETTRKNEAAVSLGRLGGLKGGAARAKALTAKKRSDIAKKAAAARWKAAKKKPK